MKRNRKIFMAVAAFSFVAAIALLTAGIIVTNNVASHSATPDTQGLRAAALSQSGGVTVVAHQDGGYGLSGYDAQGEKLWDYPLPDYITILQSAGDVFFAGAGNDVLIISSDGRLLDTLSFDYMPTEITANVQANIMAVVSTHSAMRSMISVYTVDGNWKASISGELEQSRKITQAGIGPDGNVYFGTGTGIFRCDKAGETYSARKLFDSPSSFSGFFIAENGDIYLSMFSGSMDVYKLATEGYVFSGSVGGGKSDGRIAGDGKGRVAVADYTGTVFVYDTAAQKKVAVFQAISSPGGLSISEEGVMLVFKMGEGLRYYDLDRMLAVSFFQSFQPFSIAIAVVAAAVFAVAIASCFESSYARLKLIAKQIYKSRICYLYLLPTFALFILFNYYTIVRGLSLAFKEYVPGTRADYVGLSNFVEVFKNAAFWGGTSNMVIFLVTDLLKAIIPAFIIAEVILAINNRYIQYWSRFVMFLPGILPGVASLLLWQDGILSYDGVISQLFGALGVDSLSQWAWLGSDITAKWALVFIGFPWVGSYLIFYGAVKSVPSSFYEAAKLEGCSWVKRILAIDIPLVASQIKYIYVTTFIGSIQNFSRVFLTTGGAFDTNIPALELYNNITKHQNYGVASAMGLILFVIIFIATMFNLRKRTDTD